ncbi:uncharacterized protein K444DRAFT_629398 [Hyaloscypha bicolor E]|uniref:Uncharacterized protein n=1 Tax=Hyaloscypha bicolor E TaxID=1095630 RepID=A0A2J6TBU8_9HELO|nr:uncharacterized protein K444DRAFT_629398 [Hyaloscypha bicolor E]PMD60448.1 hypothetical protein K444DRAFT_629398 [Hyaloscypha bicolor E]
MSFTNNSQLDVLNKQSREATSRLLKPFKFCNKRSPFSPAATEAEQPIKPDSNIFCSLSENQSGGVVPTKRKTNDVTTVGECAVHLELLEAFLVLKIKVLQSNAIDRVFGIAASVGKKTNLKTFGRENERVLMHLCLWCTRGVRPKAFKKKLLRAALTSTVNFVPTVTITEQDTYKKDKYNLLEERPCIDDIIICE